MVRIRLQRVGAKKQPSYRIVAIDSRAPRSGKALEIIGSYNPRTEPETVAIKGDRALYWLSVGAQPSLATKRLLVNQGIWAQFAQMKQGVSPAEAPPEASEESEPSEAPEPTEPVTEAEDEAVVVADPVVEEDVS